MPSRTDDDGNVTFDEPTAEPFQGDPETEDLKAQIAELKQMVMSQSGQIKQLANQGQTQQQTNGQPKSGRDRYAQIAKDVLKQYGADPDTVKEWKGWDGLLADFADKVLGEGFKELNDWKQQAHNAILGIEDEIGLTNFLIDPSNAQLDRSIVPQLKELYHQKQLYQAPAGHQGDWNGWKESYKSLQALRGTPSGQAPPQTASRSRIQTGGLSYPKEPTRAVPNEPSRGGLAQKYLDESPDLKEALQEVGSTQMLSGAAFEEE